VNPSDRLATLHDPLNSSCLPTRQAASDFRLSTFIPCSLKDDPRLVKDEKEGLRFAPYYARSLQALNDANGRRLSDHCPLTVDFYIGGKPTVVTDLMNAGDRHPAPSRRRRSS
jgi:hypothetical protein